MSRSERPRLEEGRDLLVRRVVSDVPTPDDLRDYAALQSFARAIDSPVSLDYWKSIPYFASFMEGYRPGERARQQLETGAATTELRSSIARLRSIDPQAVRNYEQVDYANARLRAFAAETIEKDWWKLLWVPPSMPYFAPGQCVFAVLGRFRHEAPDLLGLVECSDVGGESAELRGGTADGRGIRSDGEHSGRQESSVSAARLRASGMGGRRVCPRLRCSGRIQRSPTLVTRSPSWMTIPS